MDLKIKYGEGKVIERDIIFQDNIENPKDLSKQTNLIVEIVGSLQCHTYDVKVHSKTLSKFRANPK